MRKDLANILTLADADDVYVGTHDLGSGDHAFVIESETCRAVLMAVREGVDVCAVFGGDGDATP